MSKRPLTVVKAKSSDSPLQPPFDAPAQAVSDDFEQVETRPKTPLDLSRDSVGYLPGALSARIAIPDLERAIDEWFLDCEYRLHSPKTLATRRCFTKNLMWFLHHRSYPSCGVRELKDFFHYLRTGDEDGTRWGVKWVKKPARSITVKDYHSCMATLFKWIVTEGILAASPMENIPRPIVRFEEKAPYTPDQVKGLLEAARLSRHARRDTAILYLLLDCGIRASELCSIRIQDIDLHARNCSVLGKGDKRRTVFFGVTCGNALRLFLRERGGETHEPLFLALPGDPNRPMTCFGLLDTIARLGKAAGIKGASCNVHRLRRTFAIEWLRGGGDIFALQSMLGHTNLQMTQRYLSLARSDIEDQARQFSPADRLARIGFRRVLCH